MDNHANEPIWVRASVLVFRATAFTVLILICSGCAPMYQYENPYFIANSSATKKDTLAVLTNLEMFRAAVMQVANLQVPNSAAKTQILIFRSKEKFATFGMGSNVGGFARPYDGQFFIVVPSSGSSPWMAKPTAMAPMRTRAMALSLMLTRSAPASRMSSADPSVRSMRTERGPRQRVIASLGKFSDEDLAAGQQVQQRALTRSRRSHDGNVITDRHIKRHAAQGVDGFALQDVVLGQVL